uniref:Uncharacterized protein n=1 Tax=Arundo donax TaxID=35708 RepID=A0A0A9A4C9_ARUDO
MEMKALAGCMCFELGKFCQDRINFQDAWSNASLH